MLCWIVSYVLLAYQWHYLRNNGGLWGGGRETLLYPLLCLFELCTIYITYSKNKIFLNTVAGHSLLIWYFSLIYLIWYFSLIYLTTYIWGEGNVHTSWYTELIPGSATLGSLLVGFRVLYMVPRTDPSLTTYKASMQPLYCFSGLRVNILWHLCGERQQYIQNCQHNYQWQF